MQKSNSNTVTRRSALLNLGALAGGGLVAGLTGCEKAAQPESQTSKKQADANEEYVWLMSRPLL
jgi:hypothetical protein